MCEGVAVFKDGQFRPYEGEEYEGAVRLRLQLGFPRSTVPTVPLCFHYYFEQLGTLSLPT